MDDSAKELVDPDSGRVDSSSQALQDTLVSDRKPPGAIKKFDDDLDLEKDEDLMYDLMGFAAEAKPS